MEQFFDEIAKVLDAEGISEDVKKNIIGKLK
jgi:hypothetical protein